VALRAAVSVAALTSVVVAASGSSAGGAQAAGDPDPGVVSVIEVSGLLDRVLVDFVEQEISAAEDAGMVALVLQLNSKGAVVADAELDALLERIEDAEVPVDVWIGPKASALGDAARLVAAARTSGIDSDSRIEVVPDLVGDRSLEGEAAIGDVLGAEEAVELELVDVSAPVIGDFIVGLEGVESDVVQVGDERRREPVTQVRFGQLPLLGQLMHTVASPPVAYLLFAIGLALLVFELYTAGIGIAGVVGAGCLILGSYGLAELPTNWWAVGLLLFSAFGYAIDVQTGVPRVWTGIATVCFILGSVALYDGMSLSWLTLLVGIVGMALAMLAGMPAMVRTRFSTPTIGREWMIGELGTAVGDVDPDGVVTVRGAPWRARTNRATPIEAGGSVRVAGIDGLVLEVEPEAGGARDYRERRGRGEGGSVH
jgi:membrane-bound serine protease (ClpP class)